MILFFHQFVLLTNLVICLAFYSPTYLLIDPPTHPSVHPFLYPNYHSIPSSSIHPFTHPPVSPSSTPKHIIHVSMHSSFNLTHTTMLQSIHPSMSPSTEPRVAQPTLLVFQSCEGDHDLGFPKGICLWARLPPASAPAMSPGLLQGQIRFCCRHNGQIGLMF